MAASAANAESSSSVRRHLQGYYHASDAAMAHKNAAQALKYIDRNVNIIDKSGNKSSYSQLAGELKRLFLIGRRISVATTIQSCMVQGNGATVVINEHTMVSMFNYKTRKPLTLVENGTLREYWAKSGAGWRLKQSRILRAKQTASHR